MARNLGFLSPTVQRPSRFLVILALVALRLAVGPSAGSAAGGAQTDETVSPARGHAQVVAQGVIAVPSGDVAWRAVARTAVAAANDAAAASVLGFVVADEAPILITDEESAAQTLLAPGEAALVRPPATKRVVGLGEDDVAYYALDLVRTQDAGDAGDGEVLFASMAFPAPEGNRDLDLVRDVLAADEEGELSSSETPLLILATAGELEVLIGESTQGITLAAGEATSFAGDLTLRASGDEPASYVAAVIGPEVAGEDDDS